MCARVKLLFTLLFIIYLFLQLDSLQNPCADIGLGIPSMLQYRYQPDKEVSGKRKTKSFLWHFFYYYLLIDKSKVYSVLRLMH